MSWSAVCETPGSGSLFAEVGIQAEHHLPQQEIPECIQSIKVHKVQGFDHIAEALRHLALMHVPVPVHIQVPVRLNAGGLEHAGPVDAVGFQDILGHEVLGRGPELLEQGAVGVSQGGNVIDERVKPHVGHEVLIKRQRDPPAQPGFGP
mgnify:CR=1 FL=1